MTSRPRVTIREVARAAGVSTTTVSDALSGRGRLPDATRQRVATVARKLGYTANPAAQNLRRGRTGAIALYFPQRSFSLQYYVDLAIGVAEEALSYGYALILVPATHSSAAAPLLVDGVVISDPTVGDPMLSWLAGFRVPVVTCDRDLTPGAAHAGSVESDHQAAMRELLEHLAGQGARRIAVICPPADTAFGADVRSAYLSWASGSNAEPLTWEVPFTGGSQEITAAVRDVLALGEGADAIVAVPDGTATTVLQAVLEAGLRVPQDMLVAGYVDSPELAGLATPVTAVDLAAREMARRAAAMLAGLIEGRVQPGTRRALPTRLHIRASTLRDR